MSGETVVHPTRTICVFTGTRSEYGLLKPVMLEILKDSSLCLRLLVSGMHLSPEFGMTRTEIEDDGFSVDEAVEILLSADSATAVCKAMGLGLISFSEAFARLRPDILVVLGDRFEAFAAAATAVVHRIPLAHISGGETTEGAMDESFRHAITKMSHLHFVSAEAYRQRVIQLGEHPDRVFNVGALGVENIKHLALLSKNEAATRLGLPLEGQILLVTFHPVTLEDDTQAQLRELLAALDEFPETRIVFTKANADEAGRRINAMIEDYVTAQNGRAIVRDSLGQLLYLSVMRQVSVVVGNSSSGLMEAPSLGVPSVDIGNRQRGRIRAKSVLHCPPERKSIAEALRQAMDPRFRKSLTRRVSPFEGRDTAKTIVATLKNFDLAGIVKKVFHDLYIR